jgi:hypothetical protein
MNACTSSGRVPLQLLVEYLALLGAELTYRSTAGTVREVPIEWALLAGRGEGKDIPRGCSPITGVSSCLSLSQMGNPNRGRFKYLGILLRLDVLMLNVKPGWYAFLEWLGQG